MAQACRQVFIVGMNGSGTTMLLDHLASHPQLYGFRAETKFLPSFIARAAQYGDLDVAANYRRMWQDMIGSFIGRVGPGPERIPIPDDWEAQPRTAAGAFDRIMRQFAETQGKTVWCEKSPMYVHSLLVLAREFPDARFLHIIRDGRECAASFHRRWRFNPVRAAYRWKHAVRAGREQGGALGPRYLEVRYEDVTTAPERAFERICAFLGVPFDRAVLRSARYRPEMTGRTDDSVVADRRSAGSYFGVRELRAIESVAGRTLHELGYDTSMPDGDRDPGPWTLRRWEVADDLRRLLALTFAEGRIDRPGRWRYVLRRIKAALKQKASLRDPHGS
jgi:hypothetical protein